MQSFFSVVILSFISYTTTSDELFCSFLCKTTSPTEVASSEPSFSPTTPLPTFYPTEPPKTCEAAGSRCGLLDTLPCCPGDRCVLIKGYGGRCLWVKPTPSPSAAPSSAPTRSPTSSPSYRPSSTPSAAPSSSVSDSENCLDTEVSSIMSYLLSVAQIFIVLNLLLSSFSGTNSLPARHRRPRHFHQAHLLPPFLQPRPRRGRHLVQALLL